VVVVEVEPPQAASSNAAAASEAAVERERTANMTSPDYFDTNGT
jgi:hypothetical protein